MCERPHHTAGKARCQGGQRSAAHLTPGGNCAKLSTEIGFRHMKLPPRTFRRTLRIAWPESTLAAPLVTPQIMKGYPRTMAAGQEVIREFPDLPRTLA